MQRVLLATLVICWVMTTVTAIYCHSCESVYEPECAEDFETESRFKLDCSRVSPPRYLEQELLNRNSTACMKKVFYEQSTLKIIRSCFFGDTNETDIGCRTDPSMADVQEVGCYVCDNENYCNGSPLQHDAIRSSWVHFVFILLLNLLLFV